MSEIPLIFTVAGKPYLSNYESQLYKGVIENTSIISD